MSVTASSLLHAGCAVICLLWTLIVLGAGRRGAAPLAFCTGSITVWAAVVALTPAAPLTGLAGLFEILRTGVWFGVLALLCHRLAGASARPVARQLSWLAAGLTVVALLGLVPGMAAALQPAPLLARLGLALLVVLLAENLYRNAAEEARWHVVMPALALGGLAAFDLLIYADAVLSRAFSPALIDARAVVTVFAAPLLAVAALRDRRIRRDVPVARNFIFHGATLLVAGSFLVGVGALSEALRRMGTEWSGTAQASVLAGGVLALAVGFTAQSVRSRVRRLVVENFLRARYDYKREWLRCVATLSAQSEASGEIRAIRALADAVDSPSGVLLVRDPETGRLAWRAGWNTETTVESFDQAGEAALLAALRDGAWVAQPAPGDLAGARACLPALWLAAPLPHRDGLLGVVLLGRPRAAFAPDAEVFDLLRVLGTEVALFLAEREGAQRLAQQRQLQDYAARFAFVAHDVKTVAHQLTMLLANAETHIADPDFQQDMLLTVRASADRINLLIARLREPAGEARAGGGAGTTLAQSRLRLLAGQHGNVALRAGTECAAAIPPDAFDSAVGHLLDNAIEAAPGLRVDLHLRREDDAILLDIIDQGPGMSAAFVRDTLFRPLATAKPRGNGIGAWQARELVRRAGGDLEVITGPGRGTTMRLRLRSAEPALTGPLETTP
ncbi:MAG: PEP-CTERM system histidine kinase PrsK [Rubritepida sp.]|nr:PEP-CTERM system histidine kinase PrsK [Rubritepida sp.]